MGAILSEDLEDEVTGRNNFTRVRNPITSHNIIPAQKDLNAETVKEIKEKYKQGQGAKEVREKRKTEHTDEKIDLNLGEPENIVVSEDEANAMAEIIEKEEQ